MAWLALQILLLFMPVATSDHSGGEVAQPPFRKGIIEGGKKIEIKIIKNFYFVRVTKSHGPEPDRSPFSPVSLDWLKV